MCFDPVSLFATLGQAVSGAVSGFGAADWLSLGVGAAQTVSQYVGQQQMAKATEENALQSFRNEQADATLRQIQEQQAASQKAQEINVEEAQKASEARLSATTSNVAGISLGNVLGDISRRAGQSRQNIFRNTQMTVNQLQREKKASRSAAQGRINSAPRPSALSLVAGLAGNALDTYTTYQRRQLQIA